MKLQRIPPLFILITFLVIHVEVTPHWMDSQSLLTQFAWGSASTPRPSAQAAKLFVALGMFNSLISIFLFGNAVHRH